MKKTIHILTKITSVFLCAVLLVSFFGCTGKGVSKVSVAENAEPVLISSGNNNSHYASQQMFRDIAASGLITLMFDETSSAIGVRINSGEERSNLWSALPVSEGLYSSDEAEILSLEIVHNSERYILNSQDNSVDVKCAFWESIENGFRVVYFITDSPNKISAVSPGSADEVYSSAVGDDILYKTEVKYVLKDGCLYADLEWKNLGNKNDVLVNIGFLEYFGASQSSATGDFILVPDGSGAIIDTSTSDELEPINIPVYGNDLGQKSELSAIVPAYGMKCGEAAFAAVIEKGDAIASVTANKINFGSEFNRVGANFAVTPSQVKGDKRLYSDVSYSGEIGLSFRFLNGSDANYAGLASACREQFVRNFTLSTGSVESGEFLPILVNAIGRADKGGFALPKNLTTFEEAQDLLNRIKSKGINNAYLRYLGVLTGGLDSEYAGRADVLSALGGNSGLRELNDYASTLNFKVFVDVPLLSDIKNSKGTTGDLISSESSYVYENILKTTGFVEKESERFVKKISLLEKTVLHVLEKFNNLDSTGFCVSDAGRFLYTDYSSDTDRQGVRDIINEKLQPLSTQSFVMVDNGNFYALKTADIISDIPQTCGRAEDNGYKAVPFVQIILHGIVEYSGSPINTAEDKNVAFLRCIEYGMIPSYVVTNDNFVDSEKYTAIFSCDNWLNSMYSNYNAFTSVMGDLRTSRITDHYVVSEGVYCTVFESTTRIYVNYTNEPFTVSGVTVEPMNYFRVN